MAPTPLHSIAGSEEETHAIEVVTICGGWRYAAFVPKDLRKGLLLEPTLVVAPKMEMLAE
jgi:hypothetical protein